MPCIEGLRGRGWHLPFPAQALAWVVCQGPQLQGRCLLVVPPLLRSGQAPSLPCWASAAGVLPQPAVQLSLGPWRGRPPWVPQPFAPLRTTQLGQVQQPMRRAPPAHQQPRWVQAWARPMQVRSADTLAAGQLQVQAFMAAPRQQAWVQAWVLLVQEQEPATTQGLVQLRQWGCDPHPLTPATSPSTAPTMQRALLQPLAICPVRLPPTWQGAMAEPGTGLLLVQGAQEVAMAQAQVLQQAQEGQVITRVTQWCGASQTMGMAQVQRGVVQEVRVLQAWRLWWGPGRTSG